MTNEERWAIVHAQALREFDAIQTGTQEDRERSISDRRFVRIPGAQWEGVLGAAFDGRPKLEFNKGRLAVMRVVNEYRNNRIDVNFIPKDGEDADELADACMGMLRADEQDCTALEAYDTAFDEAVSGGFGAWRLSTDYVDPYSDEDETQRIKIEPIFDADISVYFDMNAKRQDKADAKHCFVLNSMTRPAYMDEYGDEPQSWVFSNYRPTFDWATPDVVYVAEYWKVEEVKRTVYTYQTITGDIEKHTQAEFDADPELEARLVAVGSVQIGKKRVKTRAVHKYILSGGGVLEDCGIIAGTEIPIVPVYGQRCYIDNIERCEGLVRPYRDAQMLGNMVKSRIAEIASYPTIDVPIFTPEQMAGHSDLWEDGKSYTYRLINPTKNIDGSETPMGPLGMTKAPDIPPALAALIQITETDMQDILGNQEAGEQMQPNMSGKAVELIQSRLDMQAFIYMSNMAKAKVRTGQIYLSMAADVYVEKGRKMKVIDSQGETGTVELGRPVLDKQTGAVVQEVDFARAKFDVVSDVGPSSSSRRAATVRALTGMASISQDPQDIKVLMAMAMMNMEGEGIADVRDYFRKQMVQLGVLEPTDKDKAEQAQQPPAQPDANAMLLMQTAKKAEHDAALSDAKVALTNAQTIETLAGIDLAREAQAIEQAQALQPQGGPANG
jgi:hypothetical protein